MDNWLNTGLGRDFLHSLSKIGNALAALATVQAEPGRIRLAWEIFRSNTNITSTVPGGLDIWKTIARDSFEKADAFLEVAKEREKASKEGWRWPPTS